VHGLAKSAAIPIAISICALGRNRTCDTRFRKPLLYPLSYEGRGPRGLWLADCIGRFEAAPDSSAQIAEALSRRISLQSSFRIRGPAWGYHSGVHRENERNWPWRP
jgi:hypothetical protein